LSSPKPLSPKPKNPKPRGLGLTLKSHGPPPPHPTTTPITFKHEGRVPHKKSKNKKGSAKKNSGGRKDME